MLCFRMRVATAIIKPTRLGSRNFCLRDCTTALVLGHVNNGVGEDVGIEEVRPDVSNTSKYWILYSLAGRFSLVSTLQREMTAHGCDYYYECMPWPDGVAAVGW